MSYEMFTIYDKVTGLFSSPFVSINKNAAVRSFKAMLANDPYKATDCQLYKIGEFDNQTGLIQPCGTPDFICNYEV